MRNEQVQSVIKHDRDDIHTENDELLPGGAFYVLRLFIGPWRASQRGADPMCAVMDPLADAQSIQRPDNRKVNASCVGGVWAVLGYPSEFAIDGTHAYDVTDIHICWEHNELKLRSVFSYLRVLLRVYLSSQICSDAGPGLLLC